jgi:hypothetical protein
MLEMVVYADSLLEITNISTCLGIICCSSTIRKEVFDIQLSKICCKREASVAPR